MSDSHKARDHMAGLLVKAGHSPDVARAKAVESLKRCERDRPADERRRAQK